MQVCVVIIVGEDEGIWVFFQYVGEIFVVYYWIDIVDYFVVVCDCFSDFCCKVCLFIVVCGDWIFVYEVEFSVSVECFCCSLDNMFYMFLGEILYFWCQCVDCVVQ